jgi:hypothetical protein
MRTNPYPHFSQRPTLHLDHRRLEHLQEAMLEYRKLSRNAQPVLGIFELLAVDSRAHLRQCLVPQVSIPASHPKSLDHVRPLSRHLYRHRLHQRRQVDHHRCQTSSTEEEDEFKDRWTADSPILRRHQMENSTDCPRTPRIQLYCIHLYWGVGWTPT